MHIFNLSHHNTQIIEEKCKGHKLKTGYEMVNQKVDKGRCDE
jgi:hypothetical protein